MTGLNAIPSHEPYSFIVENPEYEEYLGDIYSCANRGAVPSTENDNMVAVKISNPADSKMTFFNNRFQVDIANDEVNPGNPLMMHMVNSIAATTTYTKYLDD